MAKKTASDIAKAVAKETVVASLVEAVINELGTHDKAYKDLKEAGQKRAIKSVKNAAEKVVEKALDIMAAEQRESVMANVKMVAFDTGVKINLLAPAEQDYMYKLAQHKKNGGRVCVIMLEPAAYSENNDGEPEPEKDQKSLIEEPDKLLEDAKKLIISKQQATASMVQRELKVGYNRAVKMVEDLEKAGVVSAMKPNGSREVLLDEKGKKKK